LASEDPRATLFDLGRAECPRRNFKPNRLYGNSENPDSRRRSICSVFAIFPVVFVALAIRANTCSAAEPIAQFSVEVDLGRDRGQSFGSLFEVRDSNDRVVAGAGFMDVYNTRFRTDRHTLQFFVRPEKEPERFSTERLPHPDLDCGIYLLDLNQRLYAWSSVRNNSVRLWDDSSKKWNDAPIPNTGRMRSGDGAIRLGTGTLTFTGNQVAFDDRIILSPPEQGRYYNFYYAHGRLFFYHTQRTDADGSTHIYACPWTPESAGLIDLSEATRMSAKYVGATPFAWGQFRGEVMTVSNFGGVYVFHGSEWKTLQEAQKGVSYQVYSMLNYHDRLLLAQYPTGELFEYRGQELKRLNGWPPRLPGVSPSAREAQTMAIYRGDLFVGVWPWAEVWRYRRHEDRWHSLGRMFTHPKTTDKMTHPYEAAAKKFGLVANHWGQRVTGMVASGPSLFLSTSSKGTSPWLDEYDFLTDQQRREYGAVIRLDMPGNLAAQIKWRDRPIKLEFVIESNRLVVRQDGAELAHANFRLDGADGLRQPTVRWGQGVFGELDGKIRGRSFKSSKPAGP